jgi:hypothetical protein
MSAETHVAPAPDGPFDSLAALEAEYARLVQDMKSVLATREGIERVKGFIRRAAATGAILDAREDRAAAQGLINFWTAKLAASPRVSEAEAGDGKGRADVPRLSFEETLLANFEPSTLRAAAKAANRWLADRGPDAEPVARRIMLRLVRLSPEGRTFEPVPTSRAALFDVYPSSETVDDAVEALARAGIVRNTPGATRDFD